MNKLLLYLLIIFKGYFVFGQGIKEPYEIIKNSKNDSLIVEAYVVIANKQLSLGRVDSLLEIHKAIYNIAKTNNNKKFLATAYNFKGIHYTYSPEHVNYDSALIYYDKSLTSIEEFPPIKLHAALYNNKSLIYFLRSELEKSKKNAEIGYAYADSCNNYMIKTMTLQRLSDYYRLIGDYPTSLKYDNRSLELARKEKDTTRIILSLFQIGTSNIETKKHEEGIQILKGILSDFDSTQYGLIKSSIHLNLGMAYINSDEPLEGLKHSYKAIIDAPIDLNYYLAHNNLAEAYIKLLQNGFPEDSIPRLKKITNSENSNSVESIEELAHEYFETSLNGFKKFGNELFQTHPYAGLANLYNYQKQYDKSKEYYLKSYEIAEKNNLLKVKHDVSKALYLLNKKSKNIKEALKWHEIYVNATDSLNSEESQQEIGRQIAQFEFTNVRLKDSLEQVKKDAIQKVELEQQKKNIKIEQQKKYYLFGGLAATILLLLFLFRRFRITNKQKDLILLQKSAIEEKQIELSKTHLAIKDSINYSKKIQKAIFPSQNDLNSIFPNNFVLFKPKDIVSGDFYWCYEADNKKVIVLGDCTGHGVPGAFMTIIGINILKEILHDGIYETAEILKAINNKLKNRLNQKNDSINDGMDLGICVIDNNMIEYSGAHFPLYHITDNELIEYKGSNIFLGNDDSNTDIKTHYIPYKNGDSIYLVTDGFPDQRGGEKGKKYFYKPLRNLLLKNTKLDLEQQKQELEAEFNNWITIGNKEQMDDVSVIGIKF